MERWNGGIDLFSHPFCLLVCLPTIILWLSFQFACFYSGNLVFHPDCAFLCCCLLLFVLISV